MTTEERFCSATDVPPWAGKRQHIHDCDKSPNHSGSHTCSVCGGKWREPGDHD